MFIEKLKINPELKMKLNRNNIFSGILIFVLIVNLLVIYNIRYLYLGTIFSLVFLTVIPGLLLTLMIKIRRVDFWEYLVYVIGLSIAFLMFAGLAINWILPLCGMEKPLSLIPLLKSFDILFFIFWLIAYIRNKKILLEIKSVKLNRLNKVFLTIPIIFPILSTLGAITLNNDGPNYLTMIMLGGIASYVFLVVLFRNKLNENIYPWTIFLISISLLLMLSLRSFHIFGSDISQEFQMFQLTKLNFHWDMSNFPGNAYNACLSITLLPTIFCSFLRIDDEYIFKLIFQIIFAFTPVGIFLFSKRYSSVVLSFIAGFFFMSFPSFFFVMPMHLREEVSLFFFMLALLVIFSKNIDRLSRNIFFLIFGFSMVVSHYSTTYIALALFIFTYIVCLVFKMTENNAFFSKIYKKLNLKEKWKPVEKNYYLSGGLVILLVVFTFFWVFQFTKSSSNLVNFTNKSISNIEKLYKDLTWTESLVDQLNIFIKAKDPTLLLNNYTEKVISEYKNKSYINFYPSYRYKDYSPKVEYSQILPFNTSPNIAAKIYLFLEVIKKIVKVFIIIGVFYLLFIRFKKRKIDKEYIIFALMGLVCLVITMILPAATIDYDLTRTYQQILVVLSLPAVFGGLIVFKLIKKEKIRIISLLMIFIIYFLLYSGFIPQIVGGPNVAPQLNNFGTEYNRFYTSSLEVKSAQWLSVNYNAKYSIIYTDPSGKNRLNAFGNNSHFTFADIPIVLPSIIDKNAYVYLTVSNKVKNIGFIRIESTPIGYNFPIEFLNDNKNLIYNNGGSEIFK